MNEQEKFIRNINKMLARFSDRLSIVPEDGMFTILIDGGEDATLETEAEVTAFAYGVRLAVLPIDPGDES